MPHSWKSHLKLPKVSVDGLAIFGFFFMSDLLLDQINDGVNQYRLKQIRQGQTGRTGLTMRQRNRTGRNRNASHANKTTTYPLY